MIFKLLSYMQMSQFKRQQLQNKAILSICNVKFHKFRIKYLQNGTIKVN